MADYPMDTTVTDHLLATTRAVRKRLDLDRPVEPEVILECLRLAVQSPTGSNSQSWHWIVVTDAEKRAQLKELYGAMARPYLESQAEDGRGPADPAGVPVGRLPHEHPRPGAGPRDPVHRGPDRERRQLRRRQLLRLDPPRGLELHARPAVTRASARCGPRSTWRKEAEAAELLGIPDGISQVALIPVAYTTGDDFKPAVRPPVEDITYWDTWGATRG